jgi:hypothetical protein
MSHGSRLSVPLTHPWLPCRHRADRSRVGAGSMHVQHRHKQSNLPLILIIEVSSESEAVSSNLRLSTRAGACVDLLAQALARQHVLTTSHPPVSPHHYNISRRTDARDL